MNAFSASKKIRLVFGLNDFGVGGAERMTVQLLQRFNPEQFECHLVTLFEVDGPTLFSQLPDSISVHRFHFRHFFDVYSWWQLYRFLSKLYPDIVVSSLFFSNTVFRILQKLVGYISIPREHNTYIHKTRWHIWVDRWLAHRSYRIVAVSKTVADFTAKQEGLPREQFCVIQNGIDLKSCEQALARLPEKQFLREEYDFAENTPIFLNVARQTPQKNHRLLIQGFALFHAFCPSVVLVLVGDGFERIRLEDQVRALGLEQAVYFLGWQESVWQFYKMADWFISTSTIEGFSNAYLEALAAGLPVISTLTAGTDEWLRDGSNGFVIASSTPEEVASVCLRALAANQSEMSAQALQTARRFSTEQTVKTYQSLFQEAFSSQFFS